MMKSDSTLSVKDATGRHISLLNDQQQQQQQQQQQASTVMLPSLLGKRKYHCTESGCHKSFTTSGHLARHHRIHTGEKNFHCLHPGCPSRFSRQDNMMQHYRTHLSPKSRRQHHQQLPSRSKGSSTEYPRLHCHTMVGSEEHSAMYPLVDTQTVTADEMMRKNQPAVTTRTRRATTLPSSFYPHLSSSGYFYMTDHEDTQQRPTMVQPLSTLEKPSPMEPDSAPSPASSILTSPTLMNSNVATDAYPNHHGYHPYHPPSYQVSRRPQRVHSSSSTCSSTSSSSFLSPRSPPLVDPTDIIYPKQFIQLPPPQYPHFKSQPTQHHSMVSHHHRQGLLDLAHTVSIFG